MTFAILDFGTNTFNLLIAEASEDKGFKTLHSGKQPVKLGKGGIHNGLITPEAMERGFRAVENHLATLREYGNPPVRAIATSAIRSAGNGMQYVAEMKRRYGFDTEVITGEREAELIYKGVKASGVLPEENVLILDIGGGSNEFILCDRETIFWKRSFDLGMARILEKFTLSDPIRPEEIRELEDYFEAELEPLFTAVNEFRPAALVGASGSFETFAEMIRLANGKAPDNEVARTLDLNAYSLLHHRLLASTLEERKEMPGMEPVRVEMIVAASIFVTFVLQKCRISKLLQTDYALKEGVFAEMTGMS
ncbi:MAG: phosphatase [Bacteroidota bacterium]